ncbi:MAG: hypothetical protein ACLFUU_09705 [Desulfobacteraceae bacterium]
MTSSVVAFLRKYGHQSLVSLGCGPELNRLDNHLRLLIALKLNYYVGIDCALSINPSPLNPFSDPEGMNDLLTEYYQGGAQKFWEAVKVFPNTWVEELHGIHCAVVVCQRVYPYCRWEEIISSMQPKLVLQEDLHGCERQQMRQHGYMRTLSRIRHYGLQPFRPWPIFPWERNLILWQRQDFNEGELPSGRSQLIWRFLG